MENEKTYYVADLKKYNKEADGFEFDSTISKGIFVKDGDEFVNLFDPYDERSVYYRSNFCGEYADMFQYGTKVVLANGNGCDKYAWVLTGESYDTTLEGIENFVLGATAYYKDRIRVACKRMSEVPNLYEKMKLYKIIERDMKKDSENTEKVRAKIKVKD